MNLLNKLTLLAILLFLGILVYGVVYFTPSSASYGMDREPVTIDLTPGRGLEIISK